MSKDVSNEKILDVVERGFTAIEQRFQTIDERFDGIDKRFEGIEDKMENMESRLSQQIQGVRNSLDREIEQRKDALHDHEKRITTLEVETGLVAE
jgi:predicted  nucleic acid-binding Zn-ribbon protein